jgi:hypothetical protein
VAAQVERGNDLVLSGEFSGISVSPTAALPEIVGGVVFLGAVAPIGGAATRGIPVRDRFFACATGCLRGVLVPG